MCKQCGCEDEPTSQQQEENAGPEPAPAAT
ncbi:MAG: hypothetical protein JWN96_4617 [Mycobacterium sp.]|nr:hypothetical protein [Mycobacterium sp.]